MKGIDDGGSFCVDKTCGVMGNFIIKLFVARAFCSRHVSPLCFEQKLASLCSGFFNIHLQTVLIYLNEHFDREFSTPHKIDTNTNLKNYSNIFDIKI